VWIERIVLEYHTHAPLLRGERRDVLLVEKDLPLRRFLQTADQIEGRAFPAAGRTEETHQCAVGYFKGKIVYGGDVVFLLITPAPAGEFLCQVREHYFHKFAVLSEIRETDSAVTSISE
jgi:hypothetical protein